MKKIQKQRNKIYMTDINQKGQLTHTQSQCIAIKRKLQQKDKQEKYCRYQAQIHT